MDRKEMLDLLIHEEKYVPMKFFELAVMLQVPKKELTEFGKLLDQLVVEGRIEKSEKGKYKPIVENNMLTGVFAGSAKGFGFLRPDDPDQPDVFIPAAGVKYAMKLEGQREGGSPEGRVVKILERANDRIVGTVSVNKKIVFVIPDDKKIPDDIYITGKSGGKLKNGMKAVVKITKWPDSKKGAAGEIIEVLGFMNERGVDVMSVIRSHGIRDTFEKETLKEAEKFGEISEKARKNRLDLTKELILTIDGEDAKDLDDAISLTREKNGYRLGVHIADVSHYVKEKSALDAEAFERGTSVYFADRVVPMLPEKLSNGICSLHPGVDRLALSVFMDIDQNGKVVHYDIHKSVIRSKYRMTYKNVTGILEKDKELCREYASLVPQFELMAEVAGVLRKKRDKRGSINFDFPEAKILFDEKGRAVDVVKREYTIANQIIEEFMLACNETVAEHMFWRELPCVYRIHEKPSTEKMENFQKMLGMLGYKLKGKELRAAAFNQVLKEIEGKPEEKVLSTLMLRSFMKAKYAPENLGHFGLAAKYYCHFTSPIRRYPDLVVHRILKESIKGELESKREKFLRKFTGKASVQASETELVAQEAEREIEDMKKAEYMQRHIGEELEGVISSVTSFGLFVEFDNTVEGLVRFADLKDDYYHFDPQRLCVEGERTKKTYRIGDLVAVTVDAADRYTGQIDLSLV